MATYYELKRNAFKDIDEMFRNDLPIEIICYKIATRYGFGEKIVEKRYNQLQTVKEMNNQNSQK